MSVIFFLICGAFIGACLGLFSKKTRSSWAAMLCHIFHGKRWVFQQEIPQVSFVDSPVSEYYCPVCERDRRMRGYHAE